MYGLKVHILLPFQTVNGLLLPVQSLCFSFNFNLSLSSILKLYVGA